MKIAINKRFPPEMIQELQEKIPEHELVPVSFASEIPEEEKQVIQEIEFAISGSFSQEFIKVAKNLKVFQVPWVGVNQINLQALKEKHVKLCNSKWNDVTVAEYAIALLLASAKRLTEVDRDFRTGYWRSRYWPSIEIFGSKGLLIGYGSINKNVARFLQPFNVELYALKRRLSDKTSDEYGTRFISWEDYSSIAPRVDFVIVTLPHTKETEEILNKERLSMLKEGVILVNVGRGITIQEEALYELVKSKHIGFAGIDVWYNYHREGKTVEPVFPSKYPFHELPNVIMSPHRAANFTVRPPNYWDDVVYNITAFAEGKPLKNVVDLDRGY